MFTFWEPTHIDVRKKVQKGAGMYLTYLLRRLNVKAKIIIIDMRPTVRRIKIDFITGAESEGLTREATLISLLS